jgi:Cu(I)/Ag(I) efflux system membrane fusion protein
MKTIIVLAIGAAAGALLTLGYSSLSSSSDEKAMTDSADAPLYWVAPMDANFRRDKPGQSPMGMELVPVYATQGNESAGTVKISPNVVNNLGVRTALVERKALHIPIQTVGYVQYNEDKLVHIHPRVEGWIEQLNVKAAGEKVSENQVLYALYSPQLVNAQEEYLLAKSRKNNNLVNAAEARLVALQMPKEAISLLKKTSKVQQTIEFRAPQSGVVDNLNIRQGFYVKPGTTLMSIGALDEVWVEAEIFERQAAQVSLGLAVTMTLGFMPGKEWLGKLDYIYPTLDAETRTVRVRMRFDNQQRQLKPNMFAQVTIYSDLSAQALLVPREAVIRTGKQDRVVLALGEGKFKSIEVALGQMTSDYAQILSGLIEGDKVVSSAQFLLDSESSINSDFQRMSHSSHNANESDEVADVMPDMQSSLQLHSELQANGQAQSQEFDSATVDGVINQISTPERMMNISRGPIEKWGRGPATLDFVIHESVKLDIFRPGDTIRFSFEIRDGDFVLTEATFLTSGASQLTDGGNQ